MTGQINLRDLVRQAVRSLALLLTLLALLQTVEVRAQDDAEPLGWTSPAGPTGIFPTADAACEAQWKEFMYNGYSRHIGTRARSDDWRIVDCVWTSWQYLCPQENPGAGFLCETVLPTYVQVACPLDYIPTIDGFCRLEPAREQKCTDPCGGGDDGRPNPKRGNPVVVSTGAKSLDALDYASSDGLFRIGRQYRSFQVGRAIQQSVLPRSQMRGLKGSWNFEFMRELQLGIFQGTPASPDATVAFLLPDGTAHGFRLQGNGSWAEDSSAVFSGSSGNVRLEFVGTLPADLATIRNASSTWRVTDRNDTVWTLQTRQNVNGGPFDLAWPISMVTRDGYSQTFTYGSDSSLATLTDSFGRSASFEWSEFEVTTLSSPPAGSYPFPLAVTAVTLPDGTSLEYDYEDVPAVMSPGVYSGTKWSQTWRGPSAPSGTRVLLMVLPKHQRLVGVRRLSASAAELDSVSYLYENGRYARNITGIIDHRGVRTATYVYDTAGRVVSSVLAEGVNATTVSYSGTGTTLTRVVTSALGKEDTYQFSELPSTNNEFRLVNVASAASANTAAATTALAYGSGNFVETVTDPEGRVTQTVRDSRGRPTSITEGNGTPDQRTTTIAWHPVFNLPATVITDGLTETYAYDAQGRLDALTLTDTTTHTVPYSTNGASRTYSFSWDANGRLLSENGPLAASGPDDDVTVNTYDTGGNLLTTTNALGHVITYAGHDANGRPATMTDPNGVITAFAYDELGRVESITVNHPVDPLLDATTTMTYDAVGNITSMTLPGTSALTMEYDEANRLVAMSGAGGERIDYVHDALGNVERETVTRGDGSMARIVRRQFDELGRLMSESLGVRSAARLGYDRVSNLTSVTDGNGFATASSFDALDRVVSTVAPDGGTIGSTYDERDNALTFSDPISVTTQFTYNGFGEVIQEVSPDRGTGTYVYDAAGRMTRSTDGRGQVVDYTYDHLGRVTRMEPIGRPATEVIEYHYDTGGLAGSYGIGRLARVVDGSGTTLFRYDHRGNPTAKQQTIGSSTAAQLAYEYDLADRVTQITYPSGRLVRYGYDAHGRVNLVETRASAGAPVWDTVASGHTYEAFGPVRTMALGNGLTVANEWGSDGWLAARVLHEPQSGTDLSSLAYRRDAAGRIGAIGDLVNPNNSVIYGYDEVGRLTMAVSGGAGSATSETYSYTSGTNQLASFTDAGGTRTITHDGRGNTVSEARPGGIAVAATYDGHGRLDSYDRTNIGAQTYTYNGLGDRVRVDRPTDTRHFVYDAWGRVIAEYGASAGDVKAEFIWALPPSANGNSPFGGGDHVAGYAPLALIAENASSQLELYWVHGNHLGVPVVTTNALGQVVTPGNDFLRPGFPGQSEVLSDLYYNRARDYDPVLGRYIQADPIGLGGDPNPYLYANADPVNLIDPLGLTSFEDLLAAQQFILIKMAGDALGAANAGKSGPLYCFTALGVGGAIATEMLAGRVGRVFKAGSRFANLLRKSKAGTAAERGVAGLANKIGILRDAAKGKGNFGLGSASAQDAARLGEAWVGRGYTVASDGKTLISADGLRQFRPPSYKPRLGIEQSNFEQRLQPSGQWQSNGHLDIVP